MTPHPEPAPASPDITAPTTAAELLKVTMRMPIHDLLAALRESGLSDGSRCVWCHADEAWATSAVYWACRDCGHRGTIVELAWSAACNPRTLQRALALAAAVPAAAGQDTAAPGEEPGDRGEVAAASGSRRSA